MGARARPAATSRATTSPASHSASSASTCSTPPASSSGRGRSTSRSCTRCWRIYLQLYGVCASNGIDPANIAKMLQGRDAQDHARPTGRCGTSPTRPSGSASPTSSQATRHRRIRDALATAGGNASVWLSKFDDFLYVYGHRTEGIADMNIPSWIEDHDVAARPARQLRRRRGTPRLRRRPRRRPARARRGHRAGPVAVERRGLRRVQRTAGDHPGRQLRLVERGAQLLHRPPRHDPDARRGAGDRPRGRRRPVRRRAVPLLPRADRRLRRAAQVGRPAGDGHGPPRLLRRVPGQAAQTCPRSSARCPRRSKTRC